MSIHVTASDLPCRAVMALLAMGTAVGCGGGAPPAAPTAAPQAARPVAATRDTAPADATATPPATAAAARPKPAALPAEAPEPLTATPEQLKAWGIATAREPLQLLACYDGFGDGIVTSLAVAPDGKTFYAGGIRLTSWSLAEPKPLVDLLDGMDESKVERPLRSLAIAPDGRTLAAVDRRDRVLLWSLPERNADEPITPRDGEAPRWSTKERSKPDVPFLEGEAAERVAVSSDGTRVAAVSGDRTIEIWDAPTRSLTQVIDADGGVTSDLAWVPGTDLLIVVTQASRVRLWGTKAAAEVAGITPLEQPAVAAPSAGVEKPWPFAALAALVDIRSFPKMPGAVERHDQPGRVSYAVAATKADAERFYRVLLHRDGWRETTDPALAAYGLAFEKQGCTLTVSLTPQPVAEADGKAGLQAMLTLAGNVDLRTLPRPHEVASKSGYLAPTMVMYRAKADLTDIEAAILRSLHDRGWTATSRLNAATAEEVDRRILEFVQNGSTLSVMIGRPADAPGEYAVQMTANVEPRTIPIPADAGWVELDASTDLALVANTRMTVDEAVAFYDAGLAAEGWLAREAGRSIKDGKARLPFIRGQQDLVVRIVPLEKGGSRIIVGDDFAGSWQLATPEKSADAGAEKPGIEAADYPLPAGATAVTYDVDQKTISFTLGAGTPPAIAETMAAAIEPLGWERSTTGVVSDDYTFATFTKGKAEVEVRIRKTADGAAVQVGGDELLWTKRPPAPPSRISYGTWLRRHRHPATLDRLDEFVKEMLAIPPVGK
jgi:hypothetical protein